MAWVTSPIIVQIGLPVVTDFKDNRLTNQMLQMNVNYLITY